MLSINIRKIYFLTTLTLICLALPGVQAQTVTSGAVRGVVYEFSTRAPIAGATVTVTNRDTGLVRSALTDSGGGYFIKMLPVGVYSVNGSMQGYEIVPTSTTNIPVRILHPSVVTPPPIELRRLAPPALAGPTGAQPTTTQPTTQPANTQPSNTQTTTAQRTGAQPNPAQPAGQMAGQPLPAADDVTESEQLVNTTNASRTQHFDSRML